MTILITGSTGLVGTRLLKRFVEADIPCRALVRAGKAVPEGVERIEGDILDPASLEKAVTGVTAIIHLAAVFRTADEDLIWKVNLDGTCNLIAAAKEYAPGARFIMASTTNIYDKQSTHPGREEDEVSPTQAYPASKLKAEIALRESGLNWSIQRFGFVYGDQDGHLEAIPDHMVNLQFHPAQRMSMIHHRDIATSMHLALTGALDGRIVNVVDDAPTSVYELVALVGASMQASAEPLRYPWHLHVDGSLARRLGFTPTVTTVYQAKRQDLL
jgi:nucleoside-diphosphate-sugar epimerase